MSNPPRRFKTGSIVWAILLGTAFIVLGVSVMLPSTKRARFDYRNRSDQQIDATVPTSQPTTQR